MNNWTKIPADDVLEKTSAALAANGIHTVIVDAGEQAAKKVFELVPLGAEVMNMSSATLDTIGVAKAIEQSGKYDAVKPKLYAMDRATQGREMQKLGAAPDWAVGSVHAVTQDGKVLVASNSGSQLPAYVYAASHVIWVVGAQKVVKDLDEGMKRIYEYTLPLESERVKKAYGMPRSDVSKLLIIHMEKTPGRITMILVKEQLGF